MARTTGLNFTVVLFHSTTYSHLNSVPAQFNLVLTEAHAYRYIELEMLIAVTGHEGGGKAALSESSNEYRGSSRELKQDNKAPFCGRMTLSLPCSAICESA